jgi:hypothetical protein
MDRKNREAFREVLNVLGTDFEEIKQRRVLRGCGIKEMLQAYPEVLASYSKCNAREDAGDSDWLQIKEIYWHDGEYYFDVLARGLGGIEYVKSTQLMKSSRQLVLLLKDYEFKLLGMLSMLKRIYKKLHVSGEFNCDLGLSRTRAKRGSSGRKRIRPDECSEMPREAIGATDRDPVQDTSSAVSDSPRSINPAVEEAWSAEAGPKSSMASASAGASKVPSALSPAGKTAVADVATSISDTGEKKGLTVPHREPVSGSTETGGKQLDTENRVNIMCSTPIAEEKRIPSAVLHREMTGNERFVDYSAILLLSRRHVC